jgi:hypothetical protein
MTERRSLEGNLKAIVEDQTLLFIYPFPSDSRQSFNLEPSEQHYATNNVWVIDDLQDISKLSHELLQKAELERNEPNNNYKSMLNTGQDEVEHHWVEQYVEVCLEILPYPNQKPVSHLYIPSMLDSKRPSFSPYLFSVLLQWNRVIDDIQEDWKMMLITMDCDQGNKKHLKLLSRLCQFGIRGLCQLSGLYHTLKEFIVRNVLKLYYRRQPTKTTQLKHFSPVWTGKQVIRFEH